MALAHLRRSQIGHETGQDGLLSHFDGDVLGRADRTVGLIRRRRPDCRRVSRRLVLSRPALLFMSIEFVGALIVAGGRRGECKVGELTLLLLVPVVVPS